MKSYDLQVQGVIVSGHGVASGRSPNSPYPKSAIAMQKPYFKAGGLDLDGYFEGTLNISIAPHQFKIIKPRFHFPKRFWTDLHPPETFSFAACQITFQNKTYDSWIYYPHPETKEVHFQDTSTVEVIALLSYGSSVELAIHSGKVGII